MNRNRFLIGLVGLAALGAAALLSQSPADAQARPLPAFPGAEGAGALSLGGRGGDVLRVTNLNDDGPGSLRDAVERPGPRTVIFDIGGTIALSRPIVIREGRITIAGQTAPGGGITLRDQRLHIQADDVVVRYIRSRLGDESRVNSDAVWVSNGRRIIIDHVSAGWSSDEALSVTSGFGRIGDRLGDVTVQWSIISEALNDSNNPKGKHGYGSIAGGAFGTKLSFHHNLWAHFSGRMPRPGNYVSPDRDRVGMFADFRSNVFYNWGGPRAGYNSDKGTRATYNFVANAYLSGPDSKGMTIFEERNHGAHAYFAGNSLNGEVPGDPWSLLVGGNWPGYRLGVPAPMPAVTTDSAANTLTRVLASAGASKPRDAVDARVVASVRNRTGRVIDSQREVGGWPTLAPGRPWADRDGDGMPDDWERSHGLNPASAADGTRDKDGDGYTNLEEWLNALAR